MSSEVQVVRPIVPMDQRGVTLTSMDDAWAFCKALETSGVAPKGMKQAAIFAVVQAGAELGLSPMRALSNMKAINGRVGPMGSLAKALVRKEKALAEGTGFKETFTGTPGTDDWTATITTLRVGETEVYRTSFSVKDAKRAALWGKAGPWSQYPKRMLMWRAVGFHMQDFYSDILMGFPIAEVLADYPDERTPAVMEPLEVPAKDPLLEELEAVGATMQPPPALKVGDESVNAETGEFLKESITLLDDEPVSPQQAKPISPLSAVMAQAEADAPPPMSEEEAMADLIAEGLVAPKEEDLAATDPSNAAPEGEDPDLAF